MGILEFIIIAAVLGGIAWAVTTYVPMPGPVKMLIIGAVCLVLLVILLRAIGFSDMMMPRVR